ncbi:dihydrolipoyl dehydrogenase [Usitatibacter palustris]|uniref:Dihydrolipoyl dehydrogenase n=1 Tax=Usitatibacter palustris TaxID=2732487 RepID=A0A6M4H6D3_9PROT|nr:dihydrolipoyl dehydrogenase [Usitatibacter palustris]QJR14902.1 Dihydrolipoyl dehydrogenase [Usitatibacter palustris]
MSQAFDVVVIGAGPGGYIAAVRAAQLGFKTACIEGWKNPKDELALGGTCLNVGCIPSKALLASSEKFEEVGHHLDEHGIAVSGVKVDLAKMQARKETIVTKMTKGIEFLFKKNKVTWLQGFGKIVSAGDPNTIEVAGAGGKKESVTAKYVIIATGSKARHLPGVTVDNTTICDNEGALAFGAVPKKLGIIGAGVIGLELGSVWRRLGSEVTILEALPAFLGAADEAIAKEAWKVFTKQGLAIKLGVKIDKVTTRKTGVLVDYTDDKGLAQKLECDKLIVSVGRVPNTDGLIGPGVSLKLDDRGFVAVDDHCRTNLANVFAIGDVVRGPMLAHKAEDEGVLVAEIIAGQKSHLDYGSIPWIIYTSPEIAWAGKTEQQCKAAGIAVRTGQFPFSINGRALGTGQTAGFVKIVADAATDRVLGMHIIHAHASDLIQEGVTTMEFHGASEDIARITHGHPTLSEVVREAALALDKRSLNS